MGDVSAALAFRIRMLEREKIAAYFSRVCFGMADSTGFQRDSAVP
jgi:hypothetical protein